VGLAGVLLVFAFLIIPAAIGVLHAEAPGRQLVVAWVVGTIVSVIGLAVSFAADLSTGATLVCAFGAALAVAGIASRLRRSPAALAATAWRWIRLAGLSMAVLLVASGAWLAAFPRADQPLLDALERAVPSVRSTYMTDKDLAISKDAEQYAERYRDDAARVRAREAERRWKGEPLDEFEIRRTASFLKSYNEMIQGEVFVVREVRDRAREANRWLLAGALIAAGLVLVAGLRVARARGLRR
jgi:zinc/manganese transport system permease protein